MPISVPQSLLIILVTALVTLGTRALPFIIFSDKNKIPPLILYLGQVLPPAVIAILVVYCLQDVLFISAYKLLPQLIGIAIVVILHLWKRNNLLSIGVGTLSYILMVQYIFI